MSAMAKNRLKLKTLLFISFIVSAFFQYPTSGYCFTQADVDNFVKSYAIPAGCHIRVEGYEKPSCQIQVAGHTQEMWQGKKVILRCSLQLVSSYFFLLNESHLGTCINGPYSYEVVYAEAWRRNTYCDGRTETRFNQVWSPAAKFTPINDTYPYSYYWGYYNFYHYPRTVTYPAVCTNDDSLLKDFYPICKNDNGCCGACGPCCPIH